MPEQKSRLGRGLGALLGEILEEPVGAESAIHEIELARIRPNPFQPRREFDDASLAELEASIRENGLLQPLVVRTAGSRYEIVAGERRFRALGRLGRKSAPAVVRELSDEQMLLVALVENLQREELNPIEEAGAFQQLVDGFGLTQADVARRVGRDRSTVANALRLLTLDEEIRGLVASGELSAGHARAVLQVGGDAARLRLAREIVRKGLSVREAERLARRSTKKGSTSGRGGGKARSDPVARRAEHVLLRHFGAGIAVRLKGRTSGEIRVPFRDAADFERILRRILPGDDAAEIFEDG